MHWLKKFAQDPFFVGAIAPSSNALGRLMARGIRPEWRVLELGPGTGALTSHILPRLASQQNLTLVERDPDFVRACRNRFPDLDVRHMDATEWLKSSVGRYDAIVSGIPFAALPAKTRDRMFELVKDALKPGGVFIMFQYSLTSRGELKKLFGNVKTDFTPWNVPPAFVFTSKRLL